MGLERGPIEPLDPGQFDLRPTDPGFMALWLEHDVSFAGADRAMAATATAAASGAGEDWRTALAEPLDSAGAAVDEEGQPSNHPSFAPEAEASGALAEHLTAAEGELPAEAWQPLPDPLEWPSTMGSVPPVLPPTITGQLGAQPPGAGPLPPGLPPYVWIENTTHRGETFLHAGDWWDVHVLGKPLARVKVQGWQNDVDLGVTEVGMTDAQGAWRVLGQVTAEHVGAWRERWWVGDDMAQPELVFQVV